MSATGVEYQLDNGRIRFGGGGHTSDSYSIANSLVATSGFLDQGYYWSASQNKWFKLTWSTVPLDYAIGVGTGGSNWTGSTVEAIGTTLNAENVSVTSNGFTTVSTSGSVSSGYGSVLSTAYATVSSVPLAVTHLIELGQNDSFIKVTTTVTNLNSTTAENVNLWIGNRDDWVGTSDSPTKEKGNIVDGVFTANTQQSASASALQITSGNEGILFYSTSDGVDMVLNPSRSGGSFDVIFDTPPTQHPQSMTGDDSYGLYKGYGDIAAGASASMIWYYAAGELADLSAVVSAVANAATSAPTTTVPPVVLPPNLPALVNEPVATVPPVTTVAPTTTVPAPTTTVAPSTTVPVPVPEEGGVLPELPPGASQVFENGVPEVVEMFVEGSTELVLRGDGFQMNLAGECSFGCTIRTDPEGRQVLELEENGLARVEGEGFKPGTPVYVWLFSDPTFLGELTVNPDGSFAGSVSLAGIEIGGHTLQVNGTSADGRSRTANLGVLVSPEGVPSPLPTVLPATGSGVDAAMFAWVTLLTVVGGALVWMTRRRTVATGEGAGR